ncbi:MAG: hypothetical protein ACRENP_07585 [Longimicrobiales bacterium]
MSDERFDDLMRDAARNYNRPNDDVPLDAMWAAIEAARDQEQRATEERLDLRSFLRQPRKRPIMERTWVRMAATLVLGLAVGRLTATIGNARTGSSTPESANPDVVAAPAATAHPYQSITGHYLGETAALLVALPTELRADQADAAFLTRADDLLLRTRLLLDSPAATDPSLRALFEDLEVVLAQVVRLQADRDQTRIDLLQQSLEQRDVMPRLRNAVVDHIAD